MRYTAHHISKATLLVYPSRTLHTPIADVSKQLTWMFTLATVTPFFKQNNEKFYIWMLWVFGAARGLPLDVESRGSSSL